ncbi:hypothetical protein [Escherichia coli]|nr:hypothetical protein [Escherichia coli]
MCSLLLRNISAGRCG